MSRHATLDTMTQGLVEHPEHGPIPARLAAALDQQVADDFRAEIRAAEKALAVASRNQSATETIQPLRSRGGNSLRPETFDQMIGQTRVKDLMRRIVTAAIDRHEVLDHILLVGGSGTGKTTLGQVIAHELGSEVYQLDAPITHDMLRELRTKMNDGDVLIVDEIHRQVMPDRRGVTAAAAPEIFYTVLEDRTLVTETGVLGFPRITVIGATTDSGLLPEPFLARFPLQPKLSPYTVADMGEIAAANADALHCTIDAEARMLFAGAARGNPRQMNTYVRNAKMLTGNGHIDAAIAREVIIDLNSTTLDGLTQDMCLMLRFLYTRGSRTNQKGEVIYTASVNTIATAIGKSRDTKAVALWVEPYLIERGYVQVSHSGRILTDEGIIRAQQLLTGV